MFCCVFFSRFRSFFTQSVNRVTICFAICWRNFVCFRFSSVKPAEKTNIYRHLSLCVRGIHWAAAMAMQQTWKVENIRTQLHTHKHIRLAIPWILRCVTIVDPWTMWFFFHSHNIIIKVYSTHSPSHISFNAIFMKIQHLTVYLCLCRSFSRFPYQQQF